MKIIVSEIKQGNAPLIIEDEIIFDKKDYEQVFSLRKIEKVKVKAECANYGELINIDVHVEANLVLQCAYTLQDVDYFLKIEDTLEFSNEPLDEEIFEITGNEINLDKFILELIIANIPLRVIKKGAKLPKVKGVQVLSQDEFEAQNKDKLDPRLSALDDWEE